MALIDCCATSAAPANKPAGKPSTLPPKVDKGYVGIAEPLLKNSPPDAMPTPFKVCWLCVAFWAVVVYLLYNTFKD